MEKVSPRNSIAKPLMNLLRRFHLTLFFVLVTAGLVGAVLTINNTLNEMASSTDYLSPINAGSIDQTTLERVKALHTSSEATTPLQLPSGRVNPFGE